MGMALREKGPCPENQDLAGVGGGGEPAVDFEEDWKRAVRSSPVRPAACPGSPSPPPVGYLAPGAGHAERQLVQQFPGRLLEVPPLNLQRIRGGPAGPERARHLDVVSLPYCHIFGYFSECSWGRGRDREREA